MGTKLELQRLGMGLSHRSRKSAGATEAGLELWEWGRVRTTRTGTGLEPQGPGESDGEG